MHSFSHVRRPTPGSRGQILPLFALALVAILGMMGLGLDAAQTFLERRDAQGAADLAALSGARYLPGDPTAARTEAKAIGVANGYPEAAVLVTTPYQGSASKIQVEIESDVSLWFMPVLGIANLDVDAKAAAVAAGAGASCSFCSLNGTSKNHTLLLKNGATLRVDGDIIVNSINGGIGPDCEIKDWEVCGDGFDIFGDPAEPPAYISAKSISVAGGWETHDENVVMSDGKVWPDYSTNPPTYLSCPKTSPNPLLQPLDTQPANVCIHVPQIADPLNDPAFPAAIVPTPISNNYPIPNAINCPSGTKFPSTDPKNSNALLIATDATICPGLYHGGLKITAGKTTMLPGFYYMAGKNGLTVTGSSSIDGSAGVTIYSSATLGGANVFIVPDPDLAKPLHDDRLNPTVTIQSDENPASVGDRVKYTFTVEPTEGGPNLNGTIRFYDGSDEIPDAGKCTPKSVLNKDRKQSATCEVTYTSSDMGTHGIAGVFHSDDTCTTPTCYNSAEAVLDPVQTVVGSSDTAGDIEIDTNGTVLLSGSKGGPHKGLVLFQDRNSDGSIELTYKLGKAACGPTTPTVVKGVVGPQWALQQPPGEPCGALGGIEGTIYAPHWDSLVHTTASGLANIQVIAGKMLIDSTATTRFAFDGDVFAGNRFALFE